MTDTSTNLEKVSGAIVYFKSVDAGIAALRERFGGVVYDCTTREGLDAAKAARAEVRAPRVEVEKIRKEAKAPLLALGRDLDAEAKRITDALMAIEGPIDTQIKIEENRREAERQEKIRVEAERVAEIRRRIDTIRGWPAQYAGKGSALLRQAIEQARHYVIDTSFAEFLDEASREMARAIELLETEHEGALQREAERAELDRLRAEQAERERVEAERKAAEEAELKARREAIEREEREARERREAEDRRVREIREAIHKLHAAVAASIGADPVTIANTIEVLTHTAIDPVTFGEFAAEAELTRLNAISALQVQYTIALQRQQAAADEFAKAQEAAQAERVTVVETVLVEQPAPQPPPVQIPSGLSNMAAQEQHPRPTPRAIIDLVAMHYGVRRETAISWLREMFAVRAA